MLGYLEKLGPGQSGPGAQLSRAQLSDGIRYQCTIEQKEHLTLTSSCMHKSDKVKIGGREVQRGETGGGQ